MRELNGKHLALRLLAIDSRHEHVAVMKAMSPLSTENVSSARRAKRGEDALAPKPILQAPP